MFLCLATMKTMLNSSQCFWSERTTLADGEVEAEEPQAGHRKENGKKERNWTRVTHYLV